MESNQSRRLANAEAELATLDALIAARTAELRRLAALARAKPVLTREEIEFATALGREAASLRRSA